MSESNCLEQKPMTLVKKSKEALVASKQVQQMDEAETAKLAEMYAERYGKWAQAEAKTAQRLAAAFLVQKGRIVRQHGFDSEKPFVVTERRKQLIQRYYASGQCYVIICMEGDTEYYHQISLRDFTAWPNLEANDSKTPMQILMELWHGPDHRRRGDNRN